MDEDEDGFIADDDVSAERVEGVGGGMPAIPSGYRETDARVLEMPEASIAVEPARETSRRRIVAPEIEIVGGQRPGSERTIAEGYEEREVLPARPDVVSERGVPTEYRTVARPPEPPAPRPQSRMSAALDFAADRLGLPRVVGGRQRPTLDDAGRAIESRSLDALFPVAPRPDGMDASAPDRRDRAGMYGLGQGLTFGHLDELSGAMPLAGSMTPTQRARRRDRARAEIGQAQAQDEDAYDLGQVGAALPQMLLPGGQRTMLGRLGFAGGTGLVMGGLRGAGESEAEGLDAAGDAGGDALYEGAFNAATAGLGEGVAPILRRLGPWASRLGQRAQSAGVQSRLEGTGIWGGQAMRAADQLPGGQEALASDLRRLGIGAGVAQDASRAGRGFPRPDRALDDAAEVLDDAGERMQGVLSQMDDAARTSQPVRDAGAGTAPGHVNVTRVADEMEAIAARYEQIPIGGPQIARAIRTRVIAPLRARPVMTFGEAHEQRRVLDQMVNEWRQTPRLTTASGQLQTARRALSSAMDDAAANLDPALRDEWRQANRDYQVGAFVRERGRGAERLSVGGGIGTQAGLGLQTMVENVPGGGAIQALGGGRELAQQQRMMWPGIRARALEAIAPRLQAMGPRAQRWVQALQSAQGRGQRALAATHYALSRTDPEYRAATERLSEEEQE